MDFDDRLGNLGIQLPPLETPVGSYIHGVLVGNLLFLSGKGPVGIVGKVGSAVTIAQARQAAYQVGLYLLSAAKEELGSLNRVARVVKVLGMVNATPDFERHPEVIDSCSELLISVFGAAGHHARSSVGVGSLPGNMPLEIEAIFEVRASS